MKKLRFMAIFIMALWLTGCRYSGEVQRRIVVHGVGIDPAEDGYEVSYQIFSGKSGEGEPIDADESTVITLTANGRTLFESEENLRLKTGKEVFLGDAELVVISEELVDADIRDFLQYFEKSDIYPGVDLIYCRGLAAETLGTKLKQGSATAILLRGVVDEAVESGRAMSSRIIELSNALEQDGETVAIPILELRKPESDDSSTLTGTELGVFSSQIMTPNGAGPEISAEELSGISLLRGSAEYISLSVPIGDDFASVKCDGIKISRRISIKDGLPYVKIGIKGRYTVESSPPGAHEEDIRLAAQSGLLKLCEGGYKYIAEGDLFEISKMLFKYESGYAVEQESRLSEIIPKTSFDVEVRLSKY